MLPPVLLLQQAVLSNLEKIGESRDLTSATTTMAIVMEVTVVVIATAVAVVDMAATVMEVVVGSKQEVLARHPLC